MSIIYNEENKTFVLETTDCSYIMKVDETGCLRHLFYGGKIKCDDPSYLFRSLDRGFSGNPYEMKHDRGFSYDTIPQEYSGYGAGDYRISSVIVEQANGSQITDLRYADHRIISGKYTLMGLPYVREGKDAPETLEITLIDKVSDTEVVLRYGVFDAKNIITRSAMICNRSNRTVILRKAASFCIDHPYGDMDLIHFAGRHCMERQPERARVNGGITSIASSRGMSSHQHNPFVILCDHEAAEENGNCYGYMLMYSGSHKTEIEKDQTGSIRVISGINEQGFSWDLRPGMTFETPEMILAYSGSGLGGLSRSLHKLIRENVCDPVYLDRKRPVLINSWEACYFDFDDKKITDLAVRAAELGVEMLVLDDGWFGSRNHDKAGLGDWYVNTDKIRCGLGELTHRVNEAGLRFGLWIEPEMINEDSLLFDEHPEWVLRDPGRLPVIARDQMVLDMGRSDVVAYLFARLDEILSSAEIDYLKWDMNRSLANVYSNALSPACQGEAGHRYVMGVYDLLGRIREAYPDILIEGCAGGGGRFDAGMLFYCPQIWCSDNTDPISRLRIQKGTSYGYPVSSMGSHVSASPNHQTGRTTPLETRGTVAMSGTFGYELDPALLTEDEKDCIKKQIACYNKHYWLINQGDLYRLGDEELNRTCSCWSFVSPDRRECLLNLVCTEVEANAPLAHVQLRGLDPDISYKIETADGEESFRASGSALMQAGYTFRPLAGDYPSEMIYITACDKNE